MTLTAAEQLEVLVDNPHSDELRKKVFRTLAALDAAGVAPWIRAANDLYARGVIDEDEWIYFAAMCLEGLTLGDAVADPELLRIQSEIDALETVESAKRNDDEEYDEEGSPAMRALCVEYDRRSQEVMAEHLRELGYHELAEMVQRDHETFLDRCETGANKLFGRY